MSNLRDIIKQLIKDNEEIYSVVCKVVAVDRDKRVCKVEPKNGDAAIFNVRLQSKVSSDIGLVLFPALESDVTVTFLSKELAFVSQTSEIEDIKLDIGEFSLLIDAENFTNSVKNVLINATDHTLNATDTKINSTNYDLNGENAKFTLSEIFEVVSAKDIKLNALTFALEAATIGITGVTTITGATTINGAATISGAATMAAAVTMGGGTNGGIPKGASLITELNKIINEVNKIRTALVGWKVVPRDGGAALKARVGGLTALTTPNVGSITNDNAKH